MDGIEELRLSADVTATGQLVTGSGSVYGLSAMGDGTNASRVVVYDNTAANGTVVATLSCGASGIDRWLPLNWRQRFAKGLYASISAGSPHVTAWYK